MKKFLGDIAAPDYVYANFAMIAEGDGMINSRILDGDVVYIRQTDNVGNGDLAAVMVEDSVVSLWRIWKYPDHIVLERDNPKYKPLVFWDGDMEKVVVVGKATAFTSEIKRRKEGQQ